MADLDGDGKMDVISGSWPGEIYWFRGEGNGKFAAKVTLKQVGDTILKPGNASSVAVADWNGDGKLDIIVGTIEGVIYLCLNEGTTSAPLFGTPTLLELDGKPIRVPHGDAGPCVADWDGDGKPDLLVGCGDGSVLFFRNLGEKGRPKLAAPIALISPSMIGALPPEQIANPTRPATRAKICVADWNGDGRPDLLVGDFASGNKEYHGWVWVYLRKPTSGDSSASVGR